MFHSGSVRWPVLAGQSGLTEGTQMLDWLADHLPPGQA
jgi:hypothetical protein